MSLALLDFGCDAGEQRAAEVAPLAAPARQPRGRFGLTPEQARLPVLRVGEHVVNLADFATRVGPPPLRRSRKPEPQRLRHALDEMLELELLTIAASRRGLLETPQSTVVRKQAAVDRMLEVDFGPGGSRTAELTDEQLRAYYESHPERFTTPAAIRTSHIQLRTLGHAQRILEELSDADGMRFAQLARQHSRDSHSAQRGGSLGWVTAQPPAWATPLGTDATTRASMRGPLVPQAVRDAVFAAPQVDALLAHVVKSDQGFHVVRAEGMRPQAKGTFQQVRGLLRRELGEERRKQAIDALVDRLAKEGSLRLYPERLPRVHRPPAR